MADRLVFFGELLIRLTAPGNELLMQSPSLSLHVGGAEANVAIGLAHLGHDCAMVSTVPSNALGRGAVARSEEHTSELQSLMRISYAVFCLKKKTPHIYFKSVDTMARTETT